ncbi:MAG: Rap1a/Tai family immunity protein, partial [Sphingobium sp.]
AYIVGVVDGIKKDIFLGRAPDNCWPDQLGADQVRDLVVKYLRTYADQRSFPASLTVSVALNDAYPCKK